MNRGLRIFFILLAFALTLALITGCATVRTAGTHNTTVALQDFNSWVSDQKEFDRETRSTISSIQDHVSTYNAEIAKSQPDLVLMRENLQKDRQLLDSLGTGIDNLTAATDRFGQSTGNLNYDNGALSGTRETLGLITQYMKIYSVDMSNARQYLIEYVNNAEAYIGPEDPDYWNDMYRQNAMRAKEQAITAFAEGDTALENLTQQARNLEQLQ